MADFKHDDMVLEWLNWFEHNQGRLPSSVNKYLTYMRNLAAWLETAKGKDLLLATRQDLEEYTGLVAHKSGMRPRSRRPLVAAIIGFYRWAKDQWYIDNNPAVGLPYPSSGRRLPSPISQNYAEALLMQPKMDDFLGVRDTAIIALFIGTGLRLGGMASLNLSNLMFGVDEDGNEILDIRVIEKRDKERYIPVPSDAIYLLRAYLGHHELAGIDRSLPDGDQVLWVSVNNHNVPDYDYVGEHRRLSMRSIAEMLVKHGEAAGVPREYCHPHALRHLYATELTEDDVQQGKIQVLMGHSDPKSTAIYQHVAMRGLRKVVQKSNPLSKIRTPVTGLHEILSQR